MKITININKQVCSWRNRKILLAMGLIVAFAVIFAVGVGIGLKGKGGQELTKEAGFRYDEKGEFIGRLVEKTFLDPKYEEEKGVVLVLDKAIDVAAGSTEFEEERKGVKEMQIVNEKNLDLKSFYNKQIKMTGELMAAHTGHHHTDVLLVLESVVGSGGAAEQKKNVNEYTFATSGGKKFSFEYSPNMDLTPARGFMVGERVKLKPKGESMEDSYLITIDEPATSYGEGISITWERDSVRIGNNYYRRGTAYHDPTNQLAMILYDSISYPDLGSIIVGFGDNKRMDEALEQTKVILGSLKEVR